MFKIKLPSELNNSSIIEKNNSSVMVNVLFADEKWNGKLKKEHIKVQQIISEYERKDKKNKTSLHFKIYFINSINAFKYSKKTYCYLAVQRLH